MANEGFFYWLSEVKRSAYKTIRTYKTYLDFMFAQGGDILALTEYRQVESLILDLKKSRNWSDSTTRNCASAAVEYYAWAKREGLISQNPMGDGHAFKKADTHQITFFDWNSIAFQKLIKNPSNSVRSMAILHVLRSSGIRAGELCNLRQTDVRGRILSVDGKTGRGEAIIDEETLKWLDLYREGLKLVYSGEWLFTDEKYQRKYTEHALWRHISTLGRLAGLDHCHPHAFRHSLAGAYIMAGGDIGGAQSLLRHKSTSMTKHYLHFTSTQKVQLFDKFLKK